MVGPSRRFALADIAQQMVGGFLLAGPFVVTEEVWSLARNMEWGNTVVAIAIVFTIGYGALYKADADRDPDQEVDVGGIPLRFVSLMIVSFASVAILAFAFEAPETFDAGLATTGKALTVGAIFSVVGAATADTVF